MIIAQVVTCVQLLSVAPAPFLLVMMMFWYAYNIHVLHAPETKHCLRWHGPWQYKLLTCILSFALFYPLSFSSFCLNFNRLNWTLIAYLYFHGAEPVSLNLHGNYELHFEMATWTPFSMNFVQFRELIRRCNIILTYEYADLCGTTHHWRLWMHISSIPCCVCVWYLERLVAFYCNCDNLNER